MYGWASSRKRRPRPEEHSGIWRDFLSRHEDECRDIHRAGRQAFQDLINLLPGRISDERNLYAAARHLVQDGGESPGPNGLALGSFTSGEIWSISRILRDAIRADQYRPGPERTIAIPKASGKGTRHITVQNFEDRIVQRAALQVLQPLLDCHFDQRSFGYRPYRDRRHALGTASHIARIKERWVWVTADIRSAFDAVPHMRLIEVFRTRLPNCELAELVSMLTSRGTRRGVRQGGALSPLMLNLFLDHFLDRPWRRLHPEIPMIRYADDIALLCRTPAGARRMYADLERLLREAGVPLKVPEHDPIVDLRTGEHVDWLGFDIAHEAGELAVRLGPSTWDALADGLADTRGRPGASLRANDIIAGWLTQAGPARPKTRIGQKALLARVHEVALKLGFDEVPTIRQLLRILDAAYAQWARISTTVQRAEFLGPDGELAAPVRPHSSKAIQQSVTIATDGCCLFPERVGGYAFIIRNEQTAKVIGRYKGVSCTTNNRMEMTAVIRALSTLTVSSRVRLLTDSQYVVKGITEWLDRWKANGWRTSGRKGGRVKNCDLWRRLDEVLNQHEVSVEWVPGHAGHELNETCDRLAKYAAESMLASLGSSGP